MSKSEMAIGLIESIRLRVLGDFENNLKTPTDDVIDACYEELDGYTRTYYSMQGSKEAFTIYNFGRENICFRGIDQTEHAVEMAFNRVN